MNSVGNRKGERILKIVLHLLRLLSTRGWRCFVKHKVHAGHRKGQKCRFLSVVTLTFKLVRARNQTSSLWIWCKSIQQFQISAENPFVPGDLYFWPWPSISSEQGTKNLSQILSAVLEIFHTQTKKSQAALKLESYAVQVIFFFWGTWCSCSLVSQRGSAWRRKTAYYINV